MKSFTCKCLFFDFTWIFSLELIRVTIPCNYLWQGQVTRIRIGTRYASRKRYYYEPKLTWHNIRNLSDERFEVSRVFLFRTSVCCFRRSNYARQMASC